MGGWQGWRSFGYRPGRLGKNTLFGTVGLAARAVIQAAYLVIVSRWLGAEGYGLFAGSVALVIIGAPLANWGSALLLTRYIAQDRSRSRAMWATALVQTGVIGSLLIVVVLAISALLLPQHLSMPTLFLLALSELLLLPAAHAAASQCHALERGSASAVVTCLVPLGRTLAMLGVIMFGFEATPGDAALAHFTGSVLGLLVVVTVVAMVDGWPAWGLRLTLRQATREGAVYAVSNVAGSSYQEVDKVLMLQMIGAAVVGPYTVAFRIASIFLMPVSALIAASLPRLMVTARTGSGVRTYRAMILSAVAYGLLVGIGILILAPWVPRLFGDDYAQASHYLALMAPWPALFAFRHCLATYLTAHHRQGARSCAEIVGLGVVVALNMLLLPHMGAAAAVLALLVAEILVGALMTILIKRTHATDHHRVQRA